MLLFLHVQSHGNQRVCPEQKCSEVLRWENSKYCTKIKAGRLPETSHHSAGITGSQRIAAKPLQGSQIRPMASGLGCTQLRVIQLYFDFKGFQSNFEMNAMDLGAR